MDYRGDFDCLECNQVGFRKDGCSLKMIKGKCQRCNRKKNLTKHHLYPKHKYPLNRIYVYLCRECHDRVHNMKGYNKKEKIALNRKV